MVVETRQANRLTSASIVRIMKPGAGQYGLANVDSQVVVVSLSSSCRERRRYVLPMQGGEAAGVRLANHRPPTSRTVIKSILEIILVPSNYNVYVKGCFTHPSKAYSPIYTTTVPTCRHSTLHAIPTSVAPKLC
jgi:hypothetical protein